MGDIYEAYQHLNKTFDLGLDEVQLYAAEATFTSRYAEVSQFPADLREDTNQLMADWEFKAHLVPRQGEKITDEQRRRMQEELKAADVSGKRGKRSR